MKRAYLIAALAVLGAAGGAYSVMHMMHSGHHDMTVQATAGALSIGNAKARFLIEGRPGAVFLSINNKGSADKLVAASSSLSQRVELHTHTMDNGVMKMRPVDVIEIPANSMTELKSGGYHIMMFDVKTKPEKGSPVPLTLTFENAGDVQINAIAGDVGDTHSH
ncbi:copper chaperone PCu(A)C [Anderseniella sp. Alg231-50]|uniref:copper chaperone PCu(A)C n=1 Tax=Anderseniella sp. Alg231-50 TaxID=1922226 RepID=UPI000D55FA07